MTQRQGGNSLNRELTVQNEFLIHLSNYHMFAECFLRVRHCLSSPPFPGDLQMRPVGAVTNYPRVTESARKWEPNTAGSLLERGFPGVGEELPRERGRRGPLGFPVSHSLTSQTVWNQLARRGRNKLTGLSATVQASLALVGWSLGMV